MSVDLAGVGDADVSAVAALIGHRSRAKVLMALLDGRALPASMLAAEAGVSAPTASEHLAQLLRGGLVVAERQGRARYYRLADGSVAAALEALARISPPEPVRSLRQGSHAHALRAARTCYDHLAGRLGCALMAGMLDRGILSGGDGKYDLREDGRDRLSAPGRDRVYDLTPEGRRLLEDLGVDVAATERRPPSARYCVDWTEQRHHLAGPLGRVVMRRLLDLEWLRRTSRRRVVTLTPAGEDGLARVFGVTAAAWH